LNKVGKFLALTKKNLGSMMSCLSLGDDNGKVIRIQGWQEDSKGIEIFFSFFE